jgi:hypothetical protein
MAVLTVGGLLFEAGATWLGGVLRVVGAAQGG